MSDNLEKDYRDLINKLALKRSVERLLLALVFIGVMGIVALLFLQNSKLNTEIKNQQAAAASRAKFLANNQQQLKEQTAELKSYILCIGEFFAQPNRANETLNIQSCTTDANAFVQNGSAQTPPTSAPATTSPAAAKPSAGASQNSTTSQAAPAQPGVVQRVLQSVQKAIGGLL